ncbi:MAG: VanZ family protein [Rhodospirillaceae bacterium]|nr:VanZ family protein [Rhodospirillaceae bacterium]
MRVTLPFLCFTMWSIGIAVLSLLPAEAAISSGWSDKWEHGLAYAVLAILLKLAFSRLSTLWSWALSTLYGGLMEIGQMFAPGRYPDFLDVLANGTGAALGLSLYVAWSINQRRRRL